MKRISYIKLILVTIMIIFSSSCTAEDRTVVTSYNVQTEESSLPESISESTSAETSDTQTEETTLSSDNQTEEAASSETSGSDSEDWFEEFIKREELRCEEASKKIFESLTERGADFVPYGEGYNINAVPSERAELISDLRKTDKISTDKEAIINLLVKDSLCYSIFYLDSLYTSHYEQNIYLIDTEYFEDFSDFSDFIYETYTEECAYALINEFVLPPDQYIGKMFWEEDGQFFGRTLGVAPCNGMGIKDEYIEITADTDEAMEFILWDRKRYDTPEVVPYGIKSTAVKTDKGLRLTEMVSADPRGNKQYLDEQ